MVTWLKDNALALLLVTATGIATGSGAYALFVSRMAVLEEKMGQQEERARIIEDNTKALNNNAVLFAKIDGKLDTFEFRVNVLEERYERGITKASLQGQTSRSFVGAAGEDERTGEVADGSTGKGQKGNGRSTRQPTRYTSAGDGSTGGVHRGNLYF